MNLCEVKLQRASALPRFLMISAGNWAPPVIPPYHSYGYNGDYNGLYILYSYKLIYKPYINHYNPHEYYTYIYHKHP